MAPVDAAASCTDDFNVTSATCTALLPNPPGNCDYTAAVGATPAICAPGKLNPHIPMPYMNVL